jgi:hypothetical protein
MKFLEILELSWKRDNHRKVKELLNNQKRHLKSRAKRAISQSDETHFDNTSVSWRWRSMQVSGAARGVPEKQEHFSRL